MIREKIRYIKKYIEHYFSATHKKGHGVHSPFAFSFVCDILCEKTPYYAFGEIERIREDLLDNHKTIEVTDFGTGNNRTREISNIANNSLKPRKEAQLLFRIAHNFAPQTIIELGTSLGISTLHLALTGKTKRVDTFEGCPKIAHIAQQNFNRLDASNINIHVGDLASTLPPFLNKLGKVDLVFFDANHQEHATLNYFEQFLPHIHDNTVFIFDDIYWSKGMENAWKKIMNHTKVMVSIDLFTMGLVFFDPKITKNHYKFRY